MARLLLCAVAICGVLAMVTFVSTGQLVGQEPEDTTSRPCPGQLLFEFNDAGEVTGMSLTEYTFDGFPASDLVIDNTAEDFDKDPANGIQPTRTLFTDVAPAGAIYNCGGSGSIADAFVRIGGPFGGGLDFAQGIDVVRLGPGELDAADNG